MPTSAKKSADDFTMGIDPEIVFLDQNGRLLNAAQYLPRPAIGPDGLDEHEFGTDGHPWTGELRPPPGNPEELTKSVERIFRDNRHLLPEGTIWRAGGFVQGKSLGGHIHYGFPPSDEMVTALDGVLSQVLACVENQDEARRRKAGQYGGLGDVRRQPHGFEYRTPCSFIVSPSITLGVLALAKAIGMEEQLEGRMRVRGLRGQLLDAIKVDRGRYRACDRAHFNALLPTLWKIVHNYQFWQTDEGKRLWRYVAALRVIAKYPTGWNNDQGLLQRWKIEKPSKEPMPHTLPPRQANIPAAAILTDTELWQALANTPLNVAPATRPRPQRARVALPLATAAVANDEVPF